MALATVMGVDGWRPLDIWHRLNPDVKGFTGDTEFLFPEASDLMDRVEQRYGIRNLGSPESVRNFSVRIAILAPLRLNVGLVS